MVVSGKVDDGGDNVLRRFWSSGTSSIWSVISASVDVALNLLAKMAIFMPDWFAGKCSTSFVRPISSSCVEGLAGPETSGAVPVFVHGCNGVSSLLRRGEEEGLVCDLESFSKVLSTYTRDLCVIFRFYGVLCKHLVPPLLF